MRAKTDIAHFCAGFVNKKRIGYCCLTYEAGKTI